MDIEVMQATAEHRSHAEEISRLISEAASKQEIGLARRTPSYVAEKIEEGKAVIALTEKDELAGFCYIETWSDKEYVANSGLIVAPEYRGRGLARRIKERIFSLSRERYPDAKIFGLTTSPAVMKINQSLGYRAVPYSELTQDDEFWSGCETCPNHDILQRKEREICLCTAMLFDPEEEHGEEGRDR